jgi:molybdopterin molybdotransferase
MTATRPVSPHLESVSTAQLRLLATLNPLPAESVVLEQALGRLLRETVVSMWEHPAFDNSAMDGYAVRAADIRAANRQQPVMLPVVAEVKAGDMAPPLPLGAAIRIMTGAPLPPGADSVVRQEDTERRGATVLIEVAADAGTNVRRRGEDMPAGTPVLVPGRSLTSIDLGVAAALGRSHLDVGHRPQVAVLATGDELVPAGSQARASQVIDSNSPMLVAAVREAGGEPHFLGIGGDSPDAIRSVLEDALGCDVIISSAGVSVGDHDHINDVVAELGEIHTWGVAMRPGKPLLIGNLRGAVYLGLPGNPVSSSVTFELFARPVIQKLQGASDPQRRRLRVRLGEDVSKPAGLETYARAVLRSRDDDLPVATSSGAQGSAMLRSLAAADCLLVLPAGPTVVSAGTVVEAIPLR